MVFAKHAGAWQIVHEHHQKLRYARQEFDSDVAITFDQAGFGAVEDGFSIFDDDNEQWLGQVNFGWGGPWKAFLRYWMAESLGSDRVVGSVSGLVNDYEIDQAFVNAEFGLTYTFRTGIFLADRCATSTMRTISWTTTGRS